MQTVCAPFVPRVAATHGKNLPAVVFQAAWRYSGQRFRDRGRDIEASDSEPKGRLDFIKRRKPIGTLALLFRYGENSEDSMHSGPHFLAAQRKTLCSHGKSLLNLFRKLLSRVAGQMGLAASCIIEGVEDSVYSLRFPLSEPKSVLQRCLRSRR